MDDATSNDTLLKPNHIMAFGFETTFDGHSKKEWMKRNWHHAIYYSAVYLILIFVGQALMRRRAPFNLRILLIVWNIALCLFSCMGALRTITEISHVLIHFGFDYSVCSTSYLNKGQVTGVWVWLFTISKLVEFGDTAFVILRKQRLIFLHWYHHISTLVYAWFTYSHPIAPPRWFVAMNFMMHSFMYGYFAARAMKLKVHRFIQITITTSQITQLIMGIFVVYWSNHLYLHGRRCAVNRDTTIASFLLYFTNCALFIKFFFDSYVSKKTAVRKLKSS